MFSSKPGRIGPDNWTMGLEMISFDHKDIGPSAAMISRAFNHNAAAAINAVTAGAMMVVKAPLRRGKRRPGDLRPHLLDTIKLDRARTGDLMARVKTDSIVAKFREEDTQPHLIIAKNARALRFVPRGGTRAIFVKYVRHPGTTGVHSWAKAGLFTQSRLEPLMKIAIDAALEGRLWTSIEGGIMSGLIKADAYSLNP
jgi:hypothetical protein